MGLLAYLILLVVLGLIVGGLARLLLPGPDPMSIPATVGLGLAGELIGGLVVRALWGSPAPGLVISVLVSMAILYVVRRRGGVGRRT